MSSQGIARRIIRCCIVIGFAFGLAACGGGGGGDQSGAAASQPTQPVPSGIGAAGGTVLGPNGSKVEIPRNALAVVTQIAVDQTAANAPPLPAGLTPIGQMFAFTPHGTTFAVPVTITLPFDPGAVPGGRTPALFKTNAQNQWEQVAGATFAASSVTGQITSFSFAQVLILPELRPGGLGREWSFSEITAGEMEQFRLDGQTEGAGDVSRVFEFGAADFDQELVLIDGTILPADNSGTGMIGSAADGKTFSVAAEAPIGNANNPDIRVGSVAQLIQVQTFVKREADASLRFIVPAAFLEVHDENSFLKRLCPPFFGQDPTGPCPVIDASLSFDVQAVDNTGSPTTFFRLAGGIELDGFAESWEDHAWTDAVSLVPLWEKEDFQITIADFNGTIESFVLMEIRQPLTYEVDLSSVDVGETFHLRIMTTAYAHNAIAGPPSEGPNSAGAYFNTTGRLPVLDFAGLDTLETPDAPVFAGTPATAVACPSGVPDPQAGVLEFSAATYSRLESSRTPIVTVARTGGSVGAVSVTFTTADGTAVGGADYEPVTTTVVFADGDASPRRVLVPMLQDTFAEGDETVNLALSQPGGCAALGTPASATLIIVDDDPAAPQPSGLDQTFSADGKATLEGFGGDRSGMVVQPDGKVIMVGGTFSNFIMARFNADGTLDDGFGDTGRVTTPIVGSQSSLPQEANAVALQRDGKIVVAGNARTPNPGSRTAIALVRYLSDGRIDDSFGDSGFVFGPTFLFGRAFAVAIDGEDRIVVAGDAPVAGNTDFGDFIVARFQPDGDIDNSFGQAGIAVTDVGGVTNEAHGLKVFSDNSLLVSGFAPIVVSSSNGGPVVASDPLTAVVRYRENGTLETTFGSGGRVALPGDDVGRGLAVQADGRIVLAGSVETAVFPATLTRFALMRLLANGTIDDSFGDGGRVQTAFTQRGDAAFGVALQAYGKIVAAGGSNIQVNSNFAVARYESDGDLDTTFTDDGMLTIDFFGFTDVAENVAIQSNGKIVLGGLARNNIDGYGVARVLP